MLLDGLKDADVACFRLAFPTGLDIGSVGQLEVVGSHETRFVEGGMAEESAAKNIEKKINEDETLRRQIDMVRRNLDTKY